MSGQTEGLLCVRFVHSASLLSDVLDDFSKPILLLFFYLSVSNVLRLDNKPIRLKTEEGSWTQQASCEISTRYLLVTANMKSAVLTENNPCP